MAPRTILFLAYFHPPCATGVRRLVSLLRHLPRERWTPLVLTVKPVAGAGVDEGPLSDPLIAGVEVERTGSLDPYRLAARRGGGTATGAPSGNGFARRAMDFLRRFVFVPDDRCGWIPFAVARGVALVRRRGVSMIYSSNYPQSTHVAALAIKMLTGVPWVADFRDGWTQNPAFHRPGTQLHAWVQRRLERAVARRVDVLVTVSPPITRHLQSLRGPGLAPAVTIYNGFEAEDVRPPETAAEPLNHGRLTLLYTGTFFGGRRPDLLFAALALLPESWRTRLRVRLRCELSAEDRAALAVSGLGEMVEVLPPLAHREVLVEQRRAEALLLVLETGPGSDIMVTQKVFEYLAAGRSLFALVPHGACEELLLETGGATVCRPTDAAAVARALAEFLDRVGRGEHAPCDAGKLDSFRRDRQAMEFDRLMAEALEGR